MGNSFKDLKNNRSVRNLSSNLEKFEKGQNSFKDERIWTPKKDPAGNYSGVIRFLPAPAGETDAFVQLYNHGFQVNGKWFIENCPTSIGKDCPICEYNSELWNSGIDSNKDLVSKHYKRKESFYANILVIKDPSGPENEGKVFLFRLGAKLMEKIKTVAKGNIELGEEGNDVTDFWNGQDLVLKIREAKGYPTYEDSAFRSPSSLFKGDEAKMEEVYNQLYSLQELVSPEKFKDYDILKAAHNKIINGRQSVRTATNMGSDDFENNEVAAQTPVARNSTSRPSQGRLAEIQEEPPFVTDTEKSKTTRTTKKPAPQEESASGVSPLDYFKGLADD